MDTNYQNGYPRKESNPMAIGLLGAVAGAAIGIAMAGILSDPQKRKRVTKQVQDIQKWGNKALQDLKTTSVDTEEMVRDQAATAANKAERLQKEIEDAASQMQPRTK